MPRWYQLCHLRPCLCGITWEGLGMHARSVGRIHVRRKRVRQHGLLATGAAHRCRDHRAIGKCGAAEEMYGTSFAISFHTTALRLYLQQGADSTRVLLLHDVMPRFFFDSTHRQTRALHLEGSTLAGAYSRPGCAGESPLLQPAPRTTSVKPRYYFLFVRASTPCTE